LILILDKKILTNTLFAMVYQVYGYFLSTFLN